jgi:PAS domain-containing protein
MRADDDDLLAARASSILQQTLLGDATEHAQVGVLVWNEERRYVALNQHACELLECSRAEMLGAPVGAHNPGSSDAMQAALGELPAAGRTTLPNGSQVAWLCVRTDIGGIPHIFGLMWAAA